MKARKEGRSSSSTTSNTRLPPSLALKQLLLLLLVFLSCCSLTQSFNFGKLKTRTSKSSILPVCLFLLSLLQEGKKIHLRDNYPLSTSSLTETSIICYCLSPFFSLFFSLFLRQQQQWWSFSSYTPLVNESNREQETRHFLTNAIVFALQLLEDTEAWTTTKNISHKTNERTWNTNWNLLLKKATGHCPGNPFSYFLLLPAILRFLFKHESIFFCGHYPLFIHCRETNCSVPPKQAVEWKGSLVSSLTPHDDGDWWSRVKTRH